MTILNRLTYALVTIIVLMFVILMLGTQNVRGAAIAPADLTADLTTMTLAAGDS